MPGRDLSGMKLPEMPKYPPDVIQRFPSLKKWEAEWEEYMKKLALAIKRGVI